MIKRESSMSSDSSGNKTVGLIYTALMICLILLGTVLVRIPVPMTQGYVHLGDAVIFLAVLILGKRRAAVAAGLGSALADILGGFAFWAPWTLIIKYLMGLITGTILELAPVNSNGKQISGTLIKILSMSIGGIFMCAAYLLAERVIYGSFALAILGLPWNVGQVAVGILIATAAHPAFIKSTTNKH